jgi:hypothetical protein
MATAADITASVLAGIASLGVPWWGWTAVLVMVFWGLLAPRGEDEPPVPEEIQALRARNGR